MAIAYTAVFRYVFAAVSRPDLLFRRSFANIFADRKRPAKDHKAGNPSYHMGGKRMVSPHSIIYNTKVEHDDLYQEESKGLKIWTYHIKSM